MEKNGGQINTPEPQQILLGLKVKEEVSDYYRASSISANVIRMRLTLLLFNSVAIAVSATT